MAHHGITPFARLCRGLLALVCACLLLASCGGGGGGSSSNTTSSSPAPYIFATVSDFEVGKVPPDLLPAGSNAIASVSVLNDADGSAITNAIASINGQTLTYSSQSQDYYAYITLAPGRPIEMRIALNGKSYTASTTSFASYPSITKPASGDWWYSGEEQQLQWSASAGDADSYALGIMSSSGSLVWPRDGNIQVASATSRQASIPTGSLVAGDFYALLGQRKRVDFQGAASQSAMVVRAFSQTPITVFETPFALQSIEISTSTKNIAINGSVQLTAMGSYSNQRTRDISNSVTWSSGNTGVATVSASGRVSAAQIGQTNIQAAVRNQAVYTSLPINVYREASSNAISPSMPLSQSVAYQIDYAHSGVVSFKAPLSFPAAASWSAVLNGLTSYPLIAEGKVFVITGASSITSDRGASLYALNALTGAILWGPVDIPGNNLVANKWASHAYDNGTVFVLGSDGVMRTFNANTGSPGWFVSTTSATDADIAAPVAKDGRVYIANAGAIAAYDQVNGNLLWLSRATASANATPAIADDALLASDGCTITKFDLRTGANVWTNMNDCSSGSSSAIAYANQKLVAAGLGARGFFNATTGTAIGSYDSYALPALSSSMAYKVRGGTLSAIDVATQIGQWSFSGDGHLVSAPLLINNTVLVGSESGKVYALDATTGSQIWVGNAGQAIRAPYFFDIYPTAGLGAGLGYLVVPAGNTLTAWRFAIQ